MKKRIDKELIYIYINEELRTPAAVYSFFALIVRLGYKAVSSVAPQKKWVSLLVVTSD